jgi:ABC-type antimicrobial peptide transport system permease subunit
MNPVVEQGTSLYVIPPSRDVTPATRLTLRLLMAAVLTVLLIGCTNVANLTLARGTSRVRELAVRSAIGAGRRDLLRQLFAESLALALVAGGIGLLIALWATPVLTALGPLEMRRPRETWVDASVLGFTAAVSIATSIAFGLIPAWKISRADTVDALKSVRSRPAWRRARRGCGRCSSSSNRRSRSCCSRQPDCSSAASCSCVASIQDFRATMC